MIALADQIYNTKKAIYTVGWWMPDVDNTAQVVFQEIVNNSVAFDWNFTTNMIDF